jgi:hypothetical protein
MNTPADRFVGDIDRLGSTATAADLVRSKGQSTRFQILTKKELAAYIRSVVDEVAARMGNLDEGAQRAIEAETSARMQAILKRAKSAEQSAQNSDRVREALEQRLAEIDAQDEAVRNAIFAWQERLVAVEAESEERLGDLMVLEDELLRVEHQRQQQLAETERLRESHKRLLLQANGLVETLVGIDRRHCDGAIAATTPAPPGQDAFFHDYAVAGAVVAHLDAACARLNSLAAPAAGSLDENLTTVSQRLAAPLPLPLTLDSEDPRDRTPEPTNAPEIVIAGPELADVVAAATAVRDRVWSLHEAVAARDESRLGVVAVPVLPAADGPAAAALLATAAALRSLAGILAQVEGALDGLTHRADRSDRLGVVAADQQRRADTLAAGLLLLDATWYRGRHRQEAGPADDRRLEQPAAEAVLQRLGRDLERLRSAVGLGAEASAVEVLAAVVAGVAPDVRTQSEGGNEAQLSKLDQDFAALVAAATTIEDAARAALRLPAAERPAATVSDDVLRRLAGHAAELGARLRGLGPLQTALAGPGEATTAVAADAELYPAIAEAAAALGEDVPTALREGGPDERRRAARRVLRALANRRSGDPRMVQDQVRRVADRLIAIASSVPGGSTSEPVAALAIARDMALEPEPLLEAILAVLGLWEQA